MEFFHKVTHIPFMKHSKWSACFSILLFVLSLSMLGYRGLNWGLDFTGGLEVEIQAPKHLHVSNIRQQLLASGVDVSSVTPYGGANHFLLAFSTNEHQGHRVVSALKKALPEVEVVREDFIGPQVGEELTRMGILAVLVSIMGTMLYILYRFEYRFALSSAVALIHDPVVILGVFAYTQLEFNLIALAALLAVLGYSLNDTVVVFDRVRENFRSQRTLSPVEVMDLSINQTLSRTIMTSGLTLLVVLALLFLGGETLFGFSLGLTIGIIVGTYSSIYVAGSLSIALGLSRENLLVAKKPPRDKLVV